MTRIVVLLAALFTSFYAHAAGWYIQEQLSYPMRFTPISNERHSFRSGDISCWVTEPQFVRLPDVMRTGSTYVQESRELVCRLPDGHEAFTTVFVPTNASEHSASRDTLHIRKDGKVIAPTLAWSNNPLLGPGE